MNQLKETTRNIKIKLMIIKIYSELSNDLKALINFKAVTLI